MLSWHWVEEGGVEDECQCLGLRTGDGGGTLWRLRRNRLRTPLMEAEEVKAGGRHPVKWAGRRLQVAEPAGANAVRTEEHDYLHGREPRPSTRVPMFELTHRSPHPPPPATPVTRDRG